MGWQEEWQKHLQSSGGIAAPPVAATPQTSTRVATEQRQPPTTSYGSGGYVGQGSTTSAAANRDTASRSEKAGGAYNVAKSSDMELPWGRSNEWFGGLDEYGGINAAQSPGLMFDLYGTEVLGLNPGSATAGFYAENYNPYAMSRALGNDLGSPDQALAAGTWMADQLGKPGMTFFDPGRIVTQALAGLAQAGRGGGGGEWDFLAGLVAPGTQPHEQLQNVISFLGEALKGAMTPDALSSYLAWLESVGMEVVNQVMTSKAQGGGLAEFERNGGNIATALLSRIGQNGGM
jgi:hypothetical protein